MEHGQTPMDFIMRNLQNESPVTAEVSSTVVTPPAPEPENVRAEPEPKKEVKEDSPLQKEEPTPEISFDDKEATPETPKEAEAATEEPEEGSLQDNYKKAKQALKERKDALLKLEKEHKEVKEKLTKFETGEVLPSVIQEQEEKINKLSRYQKLYDLESSEEYQESFVKPIASHTEKLKEIVKDYGLSEDVLESALSISNRAELNRFLGQHFDEIGGKEVKDLIDQIKVIKGKALEAKKEPEEALQALQLENKKIREAQEVERKTKIADTAKSTWLDALYDIRQAGKALELIPKTDDPAHNEKHVTPIIAAAAKEYARIVKELAHLGLKEIPKELGKALANMTLLSHASATALETRTLALEKLDQVQNDSQKGRTYYRPQVGGGTPKGQQGGTDLKTSMKDDIRGLISQVQNRK